MVTRLLTAPRIDFSALRHELDLPEQFPTAVQREAHTSAARVAAEVPVRARATGVDRTDIPLVTIDPITSRDLDQALCLARRPGGYRVWYAIADVTAFVPAGGEVEAEAWRRGQTVYLPDGKVPLHPPSLSEGAASLLPGEVRPAVLWTIDLDSAGDRTATSVRRAIVRSRAKLSYAQVQRATADATLDEAIGALPELGRLLIARAADRGAINLPIPEQEVDLDGDGHGRLVLRQRVAAEEWNAQISLLTGACAAEIMLAGGIGVLRTMPAPRPAAIARLREAARALGIDWPEQLSVGQVIERVDPGSARGAAFVDHAAELLRGAGYTAFAGTPPDDPGHGAVAAPYAHVTAPLRRLVDRYAAEVCLSLFAGETPPDWASEALPRLPEVMAHSGRRAGAAERGAIDQAEAALLASRVGEEFDAAVIDIDDVKRHGGGDHGAAQTRPSGGMIALDDPPVRARCRGVLPLGERIRVRLVTADVARRTVEFAAI